MYTKRQIIWQPCSHVVTVHDWWLGWNWMETWRWARMRKPGASFPWAVIIQQERRGCLPLFIPSSHLLLYLAHHTLLSSHIYISVIAVFEEREQRRVRVPETLLHLTFCWSQKLGDAWAVNLRVRLPIYPPTHAYQIQSGCVPSFFMHYMAKAGLQWGNCFLLIIAGQMRRRKLTGQNDLGNKIIGKSAAPCFLTKFISQGE